MSEIEIKILLNTAAEKSEKAETKPEIKPDRDLDTCLNEIIQTNDINQVHALANEALRLVKTHKDEEVTAEDTTKPAGLKEYIDSKYGKSDDEKKEGE